VKIKASGKIRRRYLLIEAGSRKEVENAILEYIGVLGWAKASPVFVDVKASDKNCTRRCAVCLEHPKIKNPGFFDVKNGNEKKVLSVDRAEVENVRAAFEASKNKIRVLRVSGTIKGLG
jgi:RNase P/RNase MRP subunit POP5